MNTIASSIRNAAVADVRDKRTHVLFVVDQFPASLGGGERALLRMISGLSQEGIRCSLLVLAPFIHDLSWLPADIHVYPMTSAYNWTAIKFARKLIRLVEQQRIDAVITFFESSDIWAGTVTRLFTNAKVIWSRRDLGILRGRKHRIAYRFLSWVPDRVIAVSEQVKEFCIHEDRIASQRVTTIYNGTDISPRDPRATTEMRRKLAIPENARWVVCTANVRRIKGLDVLLNAVRKIAPDHPEALFTVVGGVNESEYMEELNCSVRAFGLESQFRFLGESNDVPAILNAADVFVLPSRSEGFSNALIEAMAAGLPSVVTDVGGNAEAIRDSESGIVVPAEDSQSLAAALSCLLTNPERARQMGAFASLEAERRFSNRKMIESLTHVLDEVCGVTRKC